MDLATTADRRFLPDCAVMLASLVASNPADDLAIHFLTDDSLSRAELDGLRSIVTEAGGRFETIRLDPVRLGGAYRSERFPVQAWYRVLLPELLPDLPRVLYLDADTLVAGSLAGLWETDLGGDLLGAVTNPLLASMIPRVQALGLPDGASYFNSGVLLIDLASWRAAAVTDAVLDFARGHPEAIWPDQDALNGVLHARRLPLHPRWNAMPGLWDVPQRLLPHTASETREAKANPAVVHFVGPYKPWHYRNRHAHRADYFAHLGTTPWRDRAIEGRSAFQAILRPLPWLWSLRIEAGAAGAGERIGALRRRLRLRERLR